MKSTKIKDLLKRELRGVREKLATLFVLAFFPWHQVLAEDSGKLFSKEGTVECKTASSSPWSAAELDTVFHPKESVRTLAASRAALLMSDGVMVRLSENAAFTFNESSQTNTVSVESGSAYFLSRQPTTFPTIKTNLVTASIRGTEFVVSTERNLTRIAVLAGSVTAANAYGTVDLSSGEEATVAPGQAPQKGLLANPLNAVQWALYYPTAVGADDLPGLRDASPIGAQLAAALDGRDVELVGKIIDASPQPWPLPFLVARAAAFMERGQIERANALLDQADTLLGTVVREDEKQRFLAAINSLRAVMAVVQNRVADARKILASLPDVTHSIGATLAMSYVRQADFELEEARSLLESAVQSNPGNGSLRARLAELYLSLGQSEQGLKEAREASRLSPEDSHPKTIEGFAHLALLEIELAERAFNDSIARSQSAGLAHLGLGLTSIRKGDLEGGKVLIQKAVHLEPSVALYRSYLGKALFELDNVTLSNQELGRAITLDPRDPTPYLYRAYNKFSQNDPIAALRDIEKSIDLNDNRAVYRSRLQLDQDSSVRGSSLARVYDTLGFSALARIEAIRSINKDYSNSSAHLLLSNSYDETNDLAQASISEFLIARLLSPINFNLVRPTDATGAGASEYSALFDRSQTRLNVGGSFRSKDRFAQPATILSGTKDNFGYALAHQVTYADGYRENDAQRESSTYGSVQYQPSADDTLLLDTNVEYFDNGSSDQVLTDPGSNDPDLEQRLDDYFVRMGWRHQFSPGSQLIAQVLSNDSKFTLEDPNYERIVLLGLASQGTLFDSTTLLGSAQERLRFKSRGIRGDLQYLYNSPELSLISGVAALNSDLHQTEAGLTSFGEDLPSSFLSSDTNNTEGSRRVYNYATVHAAEWLDLQGGVTYADLRLSDAALSLPFLETTERAEFWLPKAGAIVTPMEGSTVRAAFFESVGNSGIRELEVIEPTLVGGFNQSFFDVFPGSFSRTLALAADQKLPSETYLGVLGTKRHLIGRVPATFDLITLDTDTLATTTSVVPGVNPDNHVNEDTFKAYVYQVVGDHFSLTSDYWHIHRNDYVNGVDSATDKLRLGLNYFDSCGFFGFVHGTFRDQQLEGYEDSATERVNGAHRFWLLDVGTGYRFKNRRGQVTLSATNILDKDYRYQPLDSDPLFFPGIGAMLQFNYNFGL